jgi:hypothetical protein
MSHPPTKWDDLAQLVGDDFMKFYVCMENRWNPYSEEVRNIPWIYWVLAFNFLQVKAKFNWESVMLPHAEAIGQLTHPEIYKEYAKIKKNREKIDGTNAGDSFYEENLQGISGGGASNARYDPTKGLIDLEGNVVIPKDKYEDMLGLDGVAISW